MLYPPTQDKEKVYLLMDYVCGGDLFEHLRNQPQTRFQLDEVPRNPKQKNK
jgi:hypothetical protein